MNEDYVSIVWLDDLPNVGVARIRPTLYQREGWRVIERVIAPGRTDLAPTGAYITWPLLHVSQESATKHAHEVIGRIAEAREYATESRD